MRKFYEVCIAHDVRGNTFLGVAIGHARTLHDALAIAYAHEAKAGPVMREHNNDPDMMYVHETPDRQFGVREFDLFIQTRTLI